MTEKEARYEVYHPDDDGPTPKFDTWQEAFRMQQEWNKGYPGHKARKIDQND